MKLYKVKEVCEMTGLTRKQLYDYQNIVNPSSFEKSGYKLYDEPAVERLILVANYRKILMPLKTIKDILNEKEYDVIGAITMQIEALAVRKEELGIMIELAESLQTLA